MKNDGVLYLLIVVAAVAAAVWFVRRTAIAPRAAAPAAAPSTGVGGSSWLDRFADVVDIDFGWDGDRYSLGVNL